MTLAAKLSKDFKSLQGDLRVRKITPCVGGINIALRVKIPLKNEWEDATAAWMNPKQERIDAIYEETIKPFVQIKNQEGGESILKEMGVTFSDHDVISKDQSMRMLARLQAIEQTRTEVYFAMLVSETADAIDESYEQITSELTLEEVRAIVDAIDEVVNPRHVAAKKNSTATGAA